MPAAIERGFGAVVLQLHGIKREPATCRHLVVTLTHSEAEHTHGIHLYLRSVGERGGEPRPLEAVLLFD